MSPGSSQPNDASGRTRVAVIGAGIAGLTCGSALARAGFDVELFDKDERPGGRLATHRVDSLRFDYGAPFLPAESTLGQSWHLSDRDGPIKSLRLGMPDMNTIARELARDVNVLRCGTQITGMTRLQGRWHLGEMGGQVIGPFDWVALAVPAPQVKLLAPMLSSRVAAVRMQPCWTLMVAFGEKLPVDFDWVEFHDPVLASAVRESAKPGRVARPEAWTVYTTPAWSRAQFEQPAGRVAQALLHRFGEAMGFGLALPRARYMTAHRWRFARVATPLGEDYVLDPQQHLALAGDWCVGDGVDAARRSGAMLGVALARRGGVLGRN
jgi:predicted NAD/FAD-dependent oxidoreductase